MTRDPDRTRTHHPAPASDPALDAGLAAAFGPESTPGGWSRPPLLRDDPSDNSPIVRPDSPDMPRANSDRYQLFGEIARGGMGVILKGRDPHLGRDMAFKVLKSELAGKPAAEQRFVEEAQVGGQLQHPGILPVYDVGRFDDGRPYFAMKLVKGNTLADLLAERPTTAAERGKFLQIFLKVCETVAYAHSRGVIHRDIKPSNIMVGNYGEVLVMDWGLAKVLPRGGIADEAKATQANRERERPEKYEPTVIHTARVGSIGSETLSGSVMGTPAFMPPEQAGGEIDKLDERADVFGLGAVLCVILTGQPPYIGADPDAVRLLAIRGKLDDAFARLDACGADVELIDLARRCLAPEREDRPRHAGEVAEVICTYLAQVEDRAHRAEVERAAADARAAEEAKTRRVAEEKAAEERKRRRVQLALAASILGLVVLGGGGAWWVQSQRAARAAELAHERSETEFIVTDAIGDANRALDDGRWIDAAMAIQRAENRLGAGESFPELRAAVKQARADREMALALERAHSEGFYLFESWSGSGNMARLAAYRAAFENYGFPAWSMDDDAIQARLTSSHIGRLLTEELVYLSRLPDLKSGNFNFPELAETMRRLDYDPCRRKLSEAQMRKDMSAVLALAEDPALRDQSVVTVSRVVNYLREMDQPVSAAAFANLRLAGLAHPADFRFHAAFARLIFAKGRREDWGEGLGHMQAAVALRPQSSEAASHLGNFLLKAGTSDAAIAMYHRAIRLDPKYYMAHNNLGFVLLQKNDLAGAEAEIREAIRLNPASAMAHSNLGEFLRVKKKLADAGAECREAIRLDPNYVGAHINLGLVNLATKDWTGAEAEFSEARRLDPTFAGAHIGLGIVHHAMKDGTGAEAEFREAIRLDPTNASAHNALGAILCNVKRDYDAAAECFRWAIRLNPEFATAHSNLGDALRGKGDVDGAVASCKEAIRLDPMGAGAHNNLAWLLATGPDGTRDGKQAVELATRACELTGWKDAHDIDTLAATYAEVGDFDKAVEYAKKALSGIDKGMEAELKARLALFEQKRPYRDPTLARPELGPPPRVVH